MTKILKTIEISTGDILIVCGNVIVSDRKYKPI